MNTKENKHFSIKKEIVERFVARCKELERPASHIVEDLIMSWLNNEENKHEHRQRISESTA